MVMFDLLLTEIDSVLLLPTWMLPKLRPEEVRVSCPDAALEYKRILRRTSFHQAFLHSKPRRLMASDSLAPCSRCTVGDYGAAATLLWIAEDSSAQALRGAALSFLPTHRSVDRSRKTRRCCFLVLGSDCPRGQGWTNAIW